MKRCRRCRRWVGCQTSVRVRGQNELLWSLGERLRIGCNRAEHFERTYSTESLWSIEPAHVMILWRWTDVENHGHLRHTSSEGDREGAERFNKSVEPTRPYCVRVGSLRVRNLDLSCVEGVVFDIGGVLTLPNRFAIERHLREAGCQDLLNMDSFERAHYRAVRSMHDSHDVEFDIEDSSNWEPYDRAYASTIGLDEDRWFRVIGDTFRAGGLWTEPRVEAINAARVLHEAGVPLAVVSNNNGTALDQILALPAGNDGMRVADRFSVVIDSEVVGYTKPNPEIFYLAAEGLGIASSKLVFVGDTVYADVRGAESAGLQPVQLDPFGLHGDMDHATCESVGDLAAAILRAR